MMWHRVLQHLGTIHAHALQRGTVLRNWILRAHALLRGTVLRPGVFRVWSMFVLRAFFVILAGGVIMVLSMQYDWPLLLILVALCLVTTATITYLLFNDGPAVDTPGKSQQPQKKAATQHTPAMLQFPDTPMPATPLIRVLETIDLSSSDVEHFIDPASKGASEQPAEEHAAGTDISTNE